MQIKEAKMFKKNKWKLIAQSVEALLGEEKAAGKTDGIVWFLDINKPKFISNIHFGALTLSTYLKSSEIL